MTQILRRIDKPAFEIALGANIKSTLDRDFSKRPNNNQTSYKYAEYDWLEIRRILLKTKSIK